MYTEVVVATGRTFATLRWRDGTNHQRGSIHLVDDDGVACVRRLDPSFVWVRWVAAGELVPVVLALPPVAERLTALVALERDKEGKDGGAAFTVGWKGCRNGHGFLLGA